MFERRNIDERVQKTLFRRINALKRNQFVGDELTSKNFFVGNVLDSSNTNPITEQLYRNCFAKVSVAVPNPELSTDSNVVQQPISISSYINQQFDKTGEILQSISQKNTPLTFLQGFEENSNNRFRGHSGVTGISVSQMKYYTYKYVVDWVCPDPVYFEKTFEPSFLKLGAYIAIEFGWGIEDDRFQVPPLSIEEMIRFVDRTKGGGEALLQRNLDSSGNYYCGVGVVTKFDWKIESDGTYKGNMEVITPGASSLLETTQGTSGIEDTIPSNLQKLLQINKEREILKNKEGSNNPEIENEKFDVLKKDRNVEDIAKQLQDNSITFNMVIENLKDVFDDRLKNVSESFDFQNEGRGVEKSNPYGRQNLLPNNRGQINDDFRDGNAGELGFDASYIIKYTKYKYDNGLLNVKVVGGREVPDFYLNRYWCNWGWFEDNILQPFFNLTVKTTTGKIEQIVESTQIDNPNYCQSTTYLYTLGLNQTILPGKQHPNLQVGFKRFRTKPENDKVLDLFPLKQRRNLRRMYNIYDIIDNKFEKFEISKNEKGVIRNMVFPMEMYQKHFKGTSSLRQALRNFWADVSNQYGGYWGFQIGQSVEEPTKIGVFDSYYAPELIEKKSEPDDPTGRFEFSIYSEDSIVKEFDVSLDLSAEAATLARYSSLPDYKSGNQKKDGKKELGIEAWNILSSTISPDDAVTKEQIDALKLVQNPVQSVEYPDQTDFSNIPSIVASEQKYREDVENETNELSADGINIYTFKGDMSSYFKSIMLYLINYSDAEGSGSNIERAKIQIPIKLSMTLDGIGGLRVGDLFDVDYLPVKYREFVHFMVTKSEQKVSTTGWDTSIEAVMIAEMEKVWQKSGKKLQSGLEQYLDLFKFIPKPLNELGPPRDRIGELRQEQNSLPEDERIEIGTAPVVSQNIMNQGTDLVNQLFSNNTDNDS